MNYDVDERQTSIDNMEDTLFEKMKFAFVRDNVGDAEAIKNEWVVDDDNEPENFLLCPKSYVRLMTRLDFDRSMMELKLRKQTLLDEIAQINSSIEFLQEQKNSIIDDQQERTEEIYHDILGDEYFSE